MNKPEQKLIDALKEISEYGQDGICPYGCDTPNLAKEALKEYREAEQPKIHILFDYDDRPMKASCNGRKLEEEAMAMNDGENFPYYVFTMDIGE